MPQGLVVTGITNQIEWATHNGSGLITGKRLEVTNQAVKAVMQHMQTAYTRDEKAQAQGSFGYKIDGFGELRFYPAKREEQ
jgi:hypothetical protein